MKNKITVSPAYFKQKTNQELLAIMIPCRVYYRGQIKRFNYYLNDADNRSIRLTKSQLKKGVVENHPKKIRYNSLIHFTKSMIEQTVQNCFSNKLPLNLDEIRSQVRRLIISDFEYHLTKTLDDQKIKVSFNKYGTIEVDESVYTSFSSTSIPTQPEILDDGTIEENDWDEEDYANMLLFEQQSQDEAKLELKIKNLPTNVRFQKGHFNKENVFELFASIKYREDIDDTYNKIIIRLYEFRYFKKPDENITNLNTEWVIDFFSFLWLEGYAKVNTRNFDPLRFDGNTLLSKNREKYKPQAFHKLLEVFQTVSKKILPVVVLNEIDFNKVNLKDICGEHKNKRGIHLNENLNKEEFDKLFFYRFEQSKIKSYQELFTSHYPKSALKIKILDLEIARDLFCLQTMAGGLRGYKDLMTLRFDKSGQQLSFFADKKDETLQNPMNVYTQIIANQYNFSVPKLGINRSANSLNNIYRALLKTIAEIIPLDRQIVVENRLVKLKELFVPKFGRKTFSQILYDEYDIHTDDIAIFTGHATRSDNVLVTNYIDTKSPKKKKEIFKKIRLPKGKNTKTNRSFC